MNKVYMLKGNTYPHKNAIKSMGGRWDSLAKAWLIESKSFKNLNWKGVEVIETCLTPKNESINYDLMMVQEQENLPYDNFARGL